MNHSRYVNALLVVILVSIFIVGCAHVLQEDVSPEQTVFPFVLEGKWEIRHTEKTVRARWEACWKSPESGFMTWRDPLGRLISAVRLTPEKTEWYIPGERLIWVWENTENEWGNVFGIPFRTRDLYSWLRGKWVVQGNIMHVSSEVRGNLRLTIREEQLQGFQVKHIYREDGRLESQLWYPPWGGSVSIIFRYIDQQTEPIQLNWKWSHPRGDKAQMRWSRLKWRHHACRIPDPSKRGTWTKRWVRTVFSQNEPMILEFFK